MNGYRADIDAPFISNDDVASLEAIVAHLAAMGHRRIGPAMGQDVYVPTRRKTEGFRRAMAAAAAKLLDAGCTTICGGNDIMALGAIRAARARARGLRVPGGGPAVAGAGGLSRVPAGAGPSRPEL